MRKLFAAVLSLALVTPIVHAQRAPDLTPVPRHQLAEPAENKPIVHPWAAFDEEQLLSHRHYTTKNGRSVHSPSKTKGNVAPAGASAKCRDGTWSFSHSRRGTCSHHGGVGNWL